MLFVMSVSFPYATGIAGDAGTDKSESVVHNQASQRFDCIAKKYTCV
jgi:hypothetical protein